MVLGGVQRGCTFQLHCMPARWGTAREPEEGTRVHERWRAALQSVSACACTQSSSAAERLAQAMDGAQVQADVLALHGIASKLRAKRFQSGALRLDNVKLDFRLDADGNPCEATPHGAHCSLLRTPLSGL